MSRGSTKKRAELLAQISKELRQVGAQDAPLQQAIAQRAGMNTTDLDCLSIISMAVALTAGRLAELTGLTSGAITGVIDRLEKSGYVQRTQDKDDRRRVFVRAVEEKLREVDMLYQPLQRALDEAVSDYNNEQLALIADFLARLNPVVEGEITRLREEMQPKTRSLLNEFSSPVAGISRGRLIFARGATDVKISGDTAISGLFEAHFSGTAPSIWTEGGDVKIIQKHNFPKRPAPGEIKLNAAISWKIILQGANKVTCNLQGTQLSGFDINSGANDVTIELPNPVGAVPIHISAGVNRVTIIRPAGVAARAQISGGANQLRLDNEQINSLSASKYWETPGYEKAQHRYDITVSGGINHLTLESR